MGEPKTTGALVANILTGAGVATGAVGAVRQGQAAQQQANFQATVMRQQAEREKQIFAGQEEDFRRRQSRLMARRRALMGASGVEAGTGSPLLVSEDLASEAELQALRIRSSGETRATRLEQSAQLQRAAGRNARQRGFFRAGSSLLTGIGTTFDR